MNRITMIMLIHQILFQGMFFAKNIALKKRIGKKIKGNNIEATLLILFFILFILFSFLLSLKAISSGIALTAGLLILIVNLVVSMSSLLGLKDSWRVGVLEEQKTELITSGIYRFSRNPYFVSYILLLVAYSTLLQNIWMFVFTAIGCIFIHILILKEESYLRTQHGEQYENYLKSVPRYLIF